MQSPADLEGRAARADAAVDVAEGLRGRWRVGPAAQTHAVEALAHDLGVERGVVGGERGRLQRRGEAGDRVARLHVERRHVAAGGVERERRLRRRHADRLRRREDRGEHAAGEERVGGEERLVGEEGGTARRAVRHAARRRVGGRAERVARQEVRAAEAQRLRAVHDRGVRRHLGAARRDRLRWRRPAAGRLAHLEDLAEPALVLVVDEVAARPVRTEADRVERAAQLRLVLGVARQRAQLASAVRELALVAVLAVAALLERPTQLRLVAARRLAHAAVEAAAQLVGRRQRVAQAAGRQRPRADRRRRAALLAVRADRQQQAVAPTRTAADDAARAADMVGAHATALVHRVAFPILQNIITKINPTQETKRFVHFSARWRSSTRNCTCV